MREIGCIRRIDCGFVAVATSIIAGLVTAIAQFTAIITLTPVFYIVAFGVAILLLLTLLALSPLLNNINKAVCCAYNITLLTAGILGTLVTSVVLLAVSFAATSVLGAIVVGLLAAFFTLAVTSTLCTINCTGENCSYN